MNRRELLAALAGGCATAAACGPVDRSSVAQQPSARDDRIRKLFERMHAELCQKLQEKTGGAVRDLAGCRPARSHAVLGTSDDPRDGWPVVWIDLDFRSLSAWLPVSQWRDEADRQRIECLFDSLCQDGVLSQEDARRLSRGDIWVSADVGDGVSKSDVLAVVKLFKEAYPSR